MAASRISVELVGSSAELRDAVVKAADSLKSLGDVLAKQTDQAMAAGDKTIRINELVGKSYGAAAEQAGLASQKTIAAFERQGAVALNTSKVQIRASEETAAAAKTSAGTQVRSSNETALAGERAATRQVASAAKTKAAFGSTSSSITKSGKVISLGLLGAAAVSADLAVKFQSNTLRMQTQAGATARQLDLIRKGLVNMAAAVGFTPNVLADGMYHVVSSMNAVLPAGKRVTDELHIMRIAAEGAQVGHSNLEETTYALASALNALHDKGSDAGRVMGQLNAIVGSGDMTMKDLLEALKSGLIPTAQTFGITLSSVGAALAVMGDQGMQGALAGTRLRMSIALLGAPASKAATILQTLGLSSQQAMARTKTMSDALAAAGVSTTTLSADLRKPDGIVVALRDLDTHLRSNGLSADAAAATISRAFGGGRSGAAIELMARSTGRLDTKFKQINTTSGNFGKAFTNTTHTAAFELHSFEAGTVALATRLGTDLLPALGTGVHDLTAVVKWFERGSSAAHALEIGVGTLATVAIGSYLTSKLIGVIKLLREFGTLVRSPLGAIERIGAASRPGGAAAGGGLMPSAGGGLMIGGARSGYGLPGSVANPLIVAMEAGSYAGLGSLGAAGTVATTEKAAQAEAGVARAESGVFTLPPGPSSSILGRPAAATAGAEVGLSAMGAIKTGLGTLLKGGLLAGLGISVAQLAGGAIGGKTGSAVSSIGSGAAVGAAVGSVIPGLGTLTGAVGGAVLGGLAGAFQHFLGDDVDKYGKEIAARITKPMGPAIQKQFSQSIEKPANKAQQDRFLARTQGGGEQAPGRPAGPTISPQQAAKLNRQAAQQAALEGKHAGAAFIKSLSGMKFPTKGTLLADFRATLAKLPPEARLSATRVFVEYASGLERSKKLPHGAVNSMIGSLEKEFPGLLSYVQQVGITTNQSIADAMKFTDATGQLKQTLSNYRSQFGDLTISTKLTGDNINQNITRAMSRLKQDMTSGSAQARAAATGEFVLMRIEVGRTFDAMATQVASRQQDLTAAIADGSAKAATVASTNFFNYQQSVGSAMSAGVLTANQGSKLLTQSLNETLKAFGSKPIPLPLAVSIAGIKAAAGARSAVGGVRAFGGGAASGIAAGAAQGTMVQFGDAGGRGRDIIPVNFGGVPIMVGSGEVGAVFTRQQQQVANEALAPMGGLPGLFSNVSGKHYMARGGIVPGAQLATGGLGSPGLVNTPALEAFPFPKGEPFTWERVDQGQDLLGPPGGPVLAIGPGVVSQASDRFGGFGPFYPTEQITGGPLKGRGVYYGHTKIDRTGAVQAGDVIAHTQPRADDWTAAPAGWLELGFLPYGSMTAGNAIAPILHALAAGSRIPGIGGGGVAGLLAPAWTNLQAPSVSGTGTIAAIVRAGLGKATAAANAYGQAHTGGGAFTGTLSGPAEHQIYQYFKAAGMSKIGIAGLIGNAVQESGVNWTTPGGGMWQQISNFGSGAPSPLVQMSTMLGQIRASGVFAAMNAARSPAEAATIFMNQFEHPNVALENLPRRISGANAAYAAGYAGGGLVDGLGLFAADVKKPTNKRGSQKHHALGPADLQALAAVGGHVAGIEQDLSIKLSQYQSLSSRYGVIEQGAQYLNPDGSTNAAGIAKQIADDQVLLGIANAIETDYKQELPIVSGALRKFLGKRGKTEGSITADERKIARNKRKLGTNRLREASIRTALLDLGKPTANQVGAIEAAIKAARLKYGGAVTKAEAAQTAYHGKDQATKTSLRDAVNAAHTAEHAALDPLEAALIGAQNKDATRKLKIKQESFNLRQQLNALSTEDTKLASTDSVLGGTVSKLKGILSGAGGQVGVNKTISTLEGIAAKLGTVEWGTNGKFLGIDTKQQGAAYDEQTAVDQLTQSIAALGATPAGAPTDTSQYDALITQLNLQLSQAYALQSAQTAVLLGIRPEIPQYAEGGPVLSDGLAYLHAGEHVVPTGGTLVSNSTRPADVHIHQHFHGAAGELMSFVDQRIAHPGNVRVVSREIGRRTSMLRGAPGR